MAQDPPRAGSGLGGTRRLGALADAVQHAHDRGILHRDIKPDNVIMSAVRHSPLSEGGFGGVDRLVGVRADGGPEEEIISASGWYSTPPGPPFLRGGRSMVQAEQTCLDLVPRLTDFGLAKLIEETGSDSGSNVRTGTPYYMAPEQVACRRADIGPGTDVYGLGSTLYEVLAGRPPFRGETEVETLRLVLETEPVSPRSLRPSLPRDLETICLKCLRKEPARRYDSAAALRDDLERMLAGRPIAGRPVTAGERAVTWARRRPAIAALLILVVMLGGGLIGGMIWWSARLQSHNIELQREIARADQSAVAAKESARVAIERRQFANRHRHAENLRLAGARRRRPSDRIGPKIFSTMMAWRLTESILMASHGATSGGSRIER